MSLAIFLAGLATGLMLGSAPQIRAWIKWRAEQRLAKLGLRVVEIAVAPMGLECELSWTSLDGDTCPWITVSGKTSATYPEIRQAIDSALSAAFAIEEAWPLVSIQTEECAA